MKSCDISTVVGFCETDVSLRKIVVWLVAIQLGVEARYVDSDVFCRVERLSNIWGEFVVYSDG